MSTVVGSLPSFIEEAEERANVCLVRAAPAVGTRYGIIRAIWDLPIEPDDPRLFHAATTTASCEPLFGRSCFDRNGGSGLTRQLARASAVGETLERYAAASYDEASLVTASYTELVGQGLRALAPESIPLYSEGQYSLPSFPYRPLRHETRIRWTVGRSLVSNEDVLVPACLVFIPFAEDLDVVRAISTGLACGITPEAATLSGLYEVIERDAIMTTWMGRLPTPGLGIDQLPGLQELFESVFAPSGLELRMNDISTELGVPVVFAMAIDRINDGLALTAGAAANLDYERAALKALTEAAQGRLWLRNELAEGRMDRIADRREVVTFDDHVRWFGHRQHLAHVDFLVDSGNTARTRTAEPIGEGDENGDPGSRLEWLVAMLATAQLDVVTVDVTPTDVRDLGFTVLKTLVPGLVDLNPEHLLPPKGNMRLYEVPEHLGYGRRSEDGLYDIPHPFP